MVDHITNEKGEILARVWENKGFQEIYDYKGMEKQRRRLKRKQEQVFNQVNGQRQLFQKVYYNPALLEADELKLRQIFIAKNDSHETTSNLLKWGFFLGYFPLTYVIAKRVRPSGVLFASLAYFSVYRFGAERVVLNSF